MLHRFIITEFSKWDTEIKCIKGGVSGEQGMGYGDSEKNSRDVIIQTVRLQSKLATSAI